jgi:hypothetical protein
MNFRSRLCSALVEHSLRFKVQSDMNAQTLVRLKRTLTLSNGLKLVKSPPGDGWFPAEVRGDRFFSEYGPEIGRKDIAEIRVSEHWNE